MDNPTQKALFKAIQVLLRPLVRVLLRNGIAYGSFAELAKKTYVDVAFDDFSVPGKKQTISKVSAMTGLTRKETKRLHELGDDDDLGTVGRYNRAVRVISGWLNDPLFTDLNDQPAMLAIEGGERSFAALVKKYSGDIPTQAMLDLLEVSATVLVTGNEVRLKKHAYIPGGDPVEKLHILGTDVGEMISTIDHNLCADKTDLRFQRKVFNDSVDPDAVNDFKQMSAEKAQALLEELDAWLSEHPAKNKSSARSVSLGIYYHEKDADQENPK
ncbi:MAG TPA: hypothetical protein ENI64_09155 [Gammaproteobacteria bacterium]|nr:hypothetical protein [Gammaproteobacteria bacterium]